MSVLPTDPRARDAIPLAEGLLYYFPNALAAVAEVSRIGNEQHNPGEPMHHARGKSTDHANKILRHLIDAGSYDTDGTLHSAKVAWRALALLQEEIESLTGCPMARNARAAVSKPETVRRLAPSASFDPLDYWHIGEDGHHPMMAEALRSRDLLRDAGKNTQGPFN
jgi:hypothetical protein